MNGGKMDWKERQGGVIVSLPDADTVNPNCGD